MVGVRTHYLYEKECFQNGLAAAAALRADTS